MLALPLGALAHLRPRLAGPVLGVAGVLYTVPSLALFAILAPYTGHRPHHRAHRARLLRAARPDPQRARRACRAWTRPSGTPRAAWATAAARLLFSVELPQALPSIVAGLRLATVTTVALVTVGVVVGYGGLGQLMFRGFRSNYHAEIMTATVLCLLLALVLRPGPRGRRPPAHPVGARREAGVTWTSSTKRSCG